MITRRRSFAPLMGLVLVLFLLPRAAQAATDGARVHSALAGLHLPFVANQGQVDSRVAYYAPTFAGTLFVTREGALVYSLPGWSLTETLAGPRRNRSVRIGTTPA